MVDRKTPPPPRAKSQWSATQRDLVGEKYRAPDEADDFGDPVTGVIQNEAKRVELRSQRTTEVRFEHIEKRLDEADDRDVRREDKHDELAAVVGGIHSTVAGVTGQLTLLTGLVAKFLEAKTERDRIVTMAETDVYRAESLDSIEGRKERRALIAKVLTSGMVGGVSIAYVLHRLGVL